MIQCDGTGIAVISYQRNDQTIICVRETLLVNLVTQRLQTLELSIPESMTETKLCLLVLTF